MRRRIVVHDEARFDAIDIAYFIAEDSLEVADRFAVALGAAYKRLVNMPEIGVRREFGNPTLKGMRMWPVPGFQSYMIFYRSSDTEIRIIRVLHAARDIARLFDAPNR
jgi:toxin ParE1/3/4